MDTLIGVAYVDDNQVTELIIKKIINVDINKVEIDIEELTNT